MESQQFHLKWNNHSLNTLNSFQHLLDTSCLVDVSLTCATGKVVPAHRMVLAACSDYFYRLFKDLPEKHPVIVFKDASEQILADLLEFMYRGEVEVDESNLSDFLKFADTLQVKGLSQGDGLPAWKVRGDEEKVAVSSLPATPNSCTTPRDTPPITVKDASKLTAPAAPLPEPVSSLNKASSYHFTSAMGLPGQPKFPGFFPGLPGAEPDLYSHLTSPNLFNALKRKYPVSLGQKQGFPPLDPDNPVLKMPFLKDYFAKHPLDLSDTARLYPNLKEDDDIAERSPPPSESEGGASVGGHDDKNSDQVDPKTGAPATASGGRKPQGRGSRLERMIAAEYKILSEYSAETNGATPQDALPAITPELMKSRRTHSLQLAIGEILHNRASVQSAATKYHIPRETLRRHYQRYLKAMGINKEGGGGGGGAPSPSRTPSTTPTKSSIETLAAAAAAAAAASGGGDEAAGNYSSLLDIGQAYGIWGAGDVKMAAGEADVGDLKIDEEGDADSNDGQEDQNHAEEQIDVTCSSPTNSTPPSSTNNNNNVNNIVNDKPLAAPRPVPMEIV